ncbi:MAG TPA: hypothetical protein PKM58_10225 [Pyrinomonadaceae bacterium]|nr:hypothetical protein [Pyrinomonadaceae bacterium]
MLKTKSTIELGGTVTLTCPVCDGEREHLIRAITKQKKVTKAECTVCETSSSFRNGVKTSLSATGSQNAAPYDRMRRYRRGQMMMHLRFGIGEVVGLIEPHKIDVLFGDQSRRLVHDQH